MKNKLFGMASRFGGRLGLGGGEDKDSVICQVHLPRKNALGTRP